MTQYKTFTVGEVIDAIEENGLPRITGFYFRGDDRHKNAPDNLKEIDGACALGQAAINLGVLPYIGRANLDDDPNFSSTNLADRIVNLNDNNPDLSFKAIADILRSEFALYLEEQLKAVEWDYSDKVKVPA